MRLPLPVLLMLMSVHGLSCRRVRVLVGVGKYVAALHGGLQFGEAAVSVLRLLRDGRADAADADACVGYPVELGVVRVLHGLDLLAVLEDEVLLLVLARDARVVERDDLKAVVEDGRAARPLRGVALVPDHVRVFVGHALVLAYGELAARAAGVLDDGHPLFEKNLAAVCDEAVVAEG